MLFGLFPFVFETIAPRCCGQGRLLLALAILAANLGVNLAQDINLQDNTAPALRPETPPAELRQLLAQAVATAAAEQWDETIDLLQQVQSRAAGFILPLDNTRYVSIREICQRQLALLPPAGLARYRQRYDEQAAQALERARTAHDLAELTRVVEQWFATNSGDDALWLLGEWHLEQGRPGRARQYWSRLQRAVNSSDPAQNPNTPPARLIFPDTTIPQVEIRARLLLCTIAEQRWQVAERELKKFNADFPAAPGQLGGRKALWSELLSDTLAQARAAALPAATNGGFVSTTFAGNARRNYQSAGDIRPRMLTWSVPWNFSTIWQSDIASMRRLGLPDQRIAEDHRQLLSSIPVATDRYVLTCDDLRVYALDRMTGEPAWPSPQRRRGEIYFAAQLADPSDTSENEPGATSGTIFRPVVGHGIPRFTMTVQGSRALARLGSPVTLPLQGQAKQHPCEIVCLDLERQGLPLWTIRPPGESWIFEGTPVCDAEHAYQLLRYVDARPQWHMACYELATGVPRWRTMIGSGEAMGRGQIEAISHTLLTLAEGRLYFCTNQGASAALDAETGTIAWLAQYPRIKSQSTTHWQRDLTPPVYEAGAIYIAPSDTLAILALDAGTGEIRWSNIQAGEVLHLLGTAEGHLIATGRTVRWLELETGRLAQQWPDNDDRNQGTAAPLGRGTLAGGQILWPQRGGLARLQQRVVTADRGEQIVAAPTLLWSTINQELSGGNLLVQDEQLLVATGRQIWSLGPEAAKPKAAGSITSAATTEQSAIK